MDFLIQKGGTKIKAHLILEDGKIFSGTVFAGQETEVSGEVVFNTSMMGYQEIITDPSYKGQIVAMTYPLIGNYGVNPEDNESEGPQVEGFIVREYCDFPSNWRSTKSLKEYLEEYGVMGIEGIDTRALTRHIREAGAMKGIIATGDFDKKKMIKKANNAPGLIGRDMVKHVSCDREYEWNKHGQYHVVAVDFGCKASILKLLEEAGCRVTVVPASMSADKILDKDPDGVLLSNGPGDPAGVPYAVKTVKNLLGRVPIFGICLGQQILGLALGLSTYKLKFGHRGVNHPVKNLKTGKVEITVQNHGFCVEFPDEEERKRNEDLKGLEITHVNLNDDTLAGLYHKDYNCLTVQYHPEASAGPHDSRYIFDKFVELMA